MARQLAAITGLPLYVIDKLQFQDGGAAVPHDVYLNLHRDLLAKEIWIIDGYGDTATVLERCSVADTLIHVDLPLPTHYWWVTKRLIMGLFADPAGWPKGSPLWSSTMSRLQGHPAMPQISDAKISATDLRDGRLEVRRASQVTTRNWCFPRQRQKRIDPLDRYWHVIAAYAPYGKDRNRPESRPCANVRCGQPLTQSGHRTSH